ncbi:MAG: hypothetical protein IT572_10465 [Deltaproteobacteria bacterium]|nr:hypothetical protein [Deltaproteobacteria bacterium]
MSLQSEVKRVRYFHVVGGGCFGSQSVRWLMRARSRGMLAFDRIFAVDRDPDCRLAVEGPREEGVEVVVSDWVDYLEGKLLAQEDDGAEDHWVPSPLSPHLMMLGFQRAATRRLTGLSFEAEEFRAEVPTPVRIPLSVGTLAVSFAEWRCPVNCIEPAACPAIHAPRTWDMAPALNGYFAAHPEAGSAQVLQCRHFVHGVGTIPIAEILEAFRRMVGDLKDRTVERIAVATVSRCHGLIGAARVRRS